MRVKGTCRSANGGGVPFCMLSIYQAGFHSPLLPESPALQKGIESGQNRSKVNIYLLDFVSPRDFRRQEGAKSKHIFEIWCECVWSCAPLVVAFIVSTGPEVCRRSRIQDLPEVGSGPLVVRSPPFVRFTALRLSCRLRIWLYFAF